MFEPVTGGKLQPFRHWAALPTETELWIDKRAWWQSAIQLKSALRWNSPT
jgi:hypothetical protein